MTHRQADDEADGGSRKTLKNSNANASNASNAAIHQTDNDNAANDANNNEGPNTNAIPPTMQQIFGIDGPQRVPAADADSASAAQREPFSAIARVIDHKLEKRPDRARLLETNIIRDDNDATLPFHRASDLLESCLDTRPTREELVDVNIIKATDVAGAVQAAQQELKFRRTIDNLNDKLQKRPQVEDLKEHNILQRGHVAPALSGAARQLDFQRTSIELDKKLDTRMDKERLLEHNILKCKAGQKARPATTASPQRTAPDEKLTPALHTTSSEIKFNQTVQRVNDLVANRPPLETVQRVISNDGVVEHVATQPASSSTSNNNNNNNDK